MEAARPSRTAYGVALRRAAHQLYDAKPLVLDDPIAVRLLGTSGRVALEEAKAEAQDAANLVMRAYLVGRSRYAEDCLALAPGQGVRQYVLLGAGLDTFAHRNPHAGVRVFEVDHPATQAWKQDLVSAAGLGQPDGLRYVPCNFESQSLAEQLEQAGFRADEPAFFAWLGVVPYLTRDAFRATVRYVGARPESSGLVFDYGVPASMLSFRERMARKVFAARVAKVGEPFQLYLTPKEVAAELAGFFNLEDVGSGELNSRYFANRTDKLQMFGASGRMVSAWL